MTDNLEHLIVDTDGGLDDALALSYLARHRGVNLVAVGSVHGNVPAQAAANNSLRILELSGNTATPVAIGAEAPLNQPLHLGHPEDPVGALAGTPTRIPSAESAAEQIVRLSRQQPQTHTLLALGPLTNIALALSAEPDLPRLLHRIVIMGGAFAAAGNRTADAESNIWHDPEAADAVLSAGFDCTVVPLDVTRQAVATREWLAALATNPTHLWGQAAAALLQQPGELPPLPLHDPLAAVLALEPALAEFDHHPVRVRLDEDPARGKTTAEATDGPRPSIAVAKKVDADAFRNRLLDVFACEPQAL